MKKLTLKLMALALLIFGVTSISAQISSFPYLEDFESGAGGWTAGGTSSSWQLGTPADDVINSANSGSNAWMTNLTGDYNVSELSYIEQTFDFSGTTNPTLEFALWYEAEFSWDGGAIYLSTDGTSFSRLGSDGDPNNWYNDNSISGLNSAGSGEGWTGRNGSGSGGWVTAAHDLYAYAGEATVTMRIYFGSDGSGQDNGIAIDDISVVDLTCPTATSLAFSNITDVSATIDYTLNIALTATYTVDVQVAGVSVGAYPISGLSGTTQNLTGLMAGTFYDVTVTADCGTGDPYSDSFWTLGCDPTMDQCTYTLTLSDYGDGLAGGSDGWPADGLLTVITGNQVSTYTIAPGTYDPPSAGPPNAAELIVSIGACPGELISVYYSGTDGDTGEDVWTLTGDGGLSFEGTATDGSGIATAACPTCAAPSDISDNGSCEDGVDLEWVNAAAYDSVLVTLQWGPTVPFLQFTADTLLVGNQSSVSWENLVGSRLNGTMESPGLNTTVRVTVTGYCMPAMPTDPVEQSSVTGTYVGPDCLCEDLCSYTVTVEDTDASGFSTGWPTSYVRVILDGAPYDSIAPVASNAPESLLVETCPGSAIEFEFIDTDSWDEDVDIEITSSIAGNLVDINGGDFANFTTNTGSLYSETTCPDCLVPSDLAAINIATDSARLVWTDNAGAVSADVIVVPSGDAASTGTPANVVAPDTSYLATGLTSATAYDYYLVSICAAGSSDTVGPIAFSTLADYCAGDSFVDNGGDAADYAASTTIVTTICPDDPINDIVQVTFSEFSYENNSATCWDGLRIFDGTTTADLPITPLSLGLGSSSDVVEGFCWDRDDTTPNGTADLLGITVLAGNASGCLTFEEYADGGTQREGFIATVVCAPAPSCFSPSAMSTSNATQSTLDLSFTDENAPSLEFQYEYVLTGDAQTGANTGIAASSPATIMGLASATTYDFYMRAICAVGDTSAWTVISTSGTTLDACQAPFGLVVSNIGADTATYTWNDGDLEGAASYSYEVTLDGVAQDGTDVTTGVVDTTDMDMGLMPETAYDVYLWADCGVDGSSDTIGPISFTTLASCPPVSAGVANNETIDGADLDWTDGIGSTTGGWLLAVDTAGNAYDVANEVLVASHPHSVSGLSSGLSYDYYVRQICAVGDTSILAGPFSFTTLADYCGGDQFTDLGGATGNYPSGTNSITDPTITDESLITICPNDPGDVVSVTFTEFVFENSGATCWDGLRIYNGVGRDAGTFISPADLGVGTSTSEAEGHCWDTDNAGTGDLVGVTVLSTDPSGCLTFVEYSDGGGTRAGFIADIVCAAPPSCLAPTAFASSNITDVTADLAWTDSNGPTANGFSYAVNLSGTGLPLAWDSVMAVSPVTVSGLTGNTTYDAYIIADCDGDGISDTVSTSFTTLPSAPNVPNGVACGAASAFVYAEEFDAVGNWTGDIETGDGSWQFPHSGTTPSNFSDNPGPDGAFSGSNYTFYEASGSTTANAVMTSGMIDLTAATVGADQIELSFYMHANGPVGQFDMAITDDLGVTNDTIFTWDGGQFHYADTDPWTPVGVDISSYAGSTIQIEMRHQGNGNFSGDFAIDYLRIEACGSFCPDPSGLTASASVTDATVSWTENGSASDWALEIVSAGATPTGVAPGAFVTMANPYTASGLMSSSSYDVYVRAICGPGDSSAWVGPTTFTTNPDFCAGEQYVDNGGLLGDYSSNTDETTVICPDNIGVDVVNLTFSAFATEGCCDDLTLYDGPDDTYPVLAVLAGTTVPSETYAATLANGGCITAVFDSDGSVQDEGYVADIVCVLPPACADPVDLVCEFANKDSIAVSWTSDATSNSYDIEYGPAGFTPDSIPEANQMGSTFSLGGLPSATAYDFYVISLCGSDSSEWIGPITCATTPDFCAGDQFVDNGGLAGNYANNSDETTVICPDNLGTDIVVLSFASFGTESCCDDLTLYDGPDDTFPVLAVLAGSSAGTYVSTLANGGCITAVFDSDGSVTGTGYEADIQCIVPPDCWEATDVTVSDIGGDSAIVAWAANPNQSGTFSNDSINVYLSGATPGVDTPVFADDSVVSPLNVTGLMFDTEYDVYIITRCDEGYATPTGPVTFTTDPTCFPAEGIMVSDISPDTASVSWTAGAEQTAPVNAYNIEVYPTGTDTVGTAALYSATGVSSPHTVMGLSELSTYDLYITTDCFAGDLSAASDTVMFSTPASCLAPLGITSFAISTSGASLSWTGANMPAAPSYDVYVVAAGETDTTGALVGDDVTAPYVLTGLDSFTGYDVYVLANCGSGGSPLSPVHSFFTLIEGPQGVTCTTGSSTVIFSEDFETDPPAGWSGSFAGGGNQWDITAANANSGGTGPANSISGSNHAEYEGTSSTTGQSSVITTPMIDLSAAVDGAELSFYIHAFGGGIGPFNVSVTTDGGVTADTLFTVTSQLQTADSDDWIHVGLDLSAYLGQVIEIQFANQYSGDFEADVSIDLVEVEACGDFCLEIADLTCGVAAIDSLQISWTGDAAHVDYDIAVYEAGADTSVATPVSTTTGVLGTTHTEMGLSSGTSYDFYVTSNCASSSANTVGPVTCTTLLDYCAGDQYIDEAGPTTNYPNNALETTTICPDNVGVDVVQITFTEFATEGCCDDLTLYDGPDDTYPVIAVLAGTTVPTASFTATLANGGCITGVFDSDGSINNPGFIADVACIESIPPENDSCVGAELLTVGSGDDCTSGTAADLVFATASGIATSPQCVQATDPVDMWFKAVVPASGRVLIDFPVQPGNAMFSELFIGNACSLTYLNNSCNGIHPKAYPQRGSAQVDALTPGDTLYIRVWEAGNNELGPFEICVNDPLPANSDCDASVTAPISDHGTPAWVTSRSNYAYSNPSACGNGGETVWFDFVATDANQLIYTRPLPGGDYDAVVEVFDACLGTSLGCFNNYGAGEIERVMITGLVAGTSYKYSVSHADGPNTASSDYFETGVRRFNDESLNSDHCNVLNYTLQDAVYATRDDLGDMYTNLNVPVTAYGFRFQEVGGGLDISIQQGPSVPYIQLDDVPGLEYGKTYNVSVQHQIRVNVNGVIDLYWSDFNDPCVIGLQAGVPSTTLTAEFCPSGSDLYLQDQIQAIPVFGATSYRFTLVGGGETFVKVSNNYALLLYTVGTPGNRMQYASTTYDVTVEAFVNGEWSAPGGVCTIGMASQPENTELQSAYCNLTYNMPNDPNYILAEYVYGADMYEFRFTPVGGGVAQTEIRPGISLPFHISNLNLASGQYDVDVRANAGGVWGDYVNFCPITINNTAPGVEGEETASVKLAELSSAIQASIFPNPGTGENVFISLTELTDENQKIVVEVVDITGKIVHSEQVVNKGAEANFIVDFDSPLSKGMYFVNMYVNDVKLVEKLTIE